MRKMLLSTVFITAFVPFSVQAAEISETGAQDIAKKLTHYLPQDIIDTGFLKVIAGTKRYELSIDVLPLLKDVDKSLYSVSGLKPFVHYLTPQDDGTWKVEISDHFNISGFFTASGQKQNFTYLIDKVTFDGMFDPSMSYFSSGKYNLDKMAVTTQSGPNGIAANIESLTTDIKGDKVSEGVVDLSGTMSMKNLSETVTDPATGNVVMSAASMTGSVEMRRLGITALRDLVVFGLDLAKAKTDRLDAAQSDKLKALLKANVPFTDNFVEKIKFLDVKIAAQGMDAAVKEVNYNVDFSGFKADSRAGAEFGFVDPVVPAGLLPPGTEGTVPQSANFGVAITGLNLEGMANYAIENSDFTKSSPLTPEQSDELGRIVLPSGKMNFEFYNVFAKSAVYDLTMTGKMQVDPKDSDKPNVDVTIVAKDLDKTIKFLQANASTVPQFGQASFMILMMKGFGKQQDDGTMVWNVKLSEDGKVMINGQEMKI